MIKQTAPSVAGLTWRSLTPADTAAIVAMTTKTAHADGREPTATPESIAQIFAMLGDHVSDNTRAAFTATGLLAAMALLLVNDDSRGLKAQFDINVGARYRGLGLEDSLLDWVEVQARRHVMGQENSSSAVVSTSLSDEAARYAARLVERGYEAAHYGFEMARPLTRKLPEAPLPAGLSLLRWHPECEPALMAAFNIAFAEHDGLPHMTPALWETHFTRVPPFRGDLSYLVMAGQEIAGFCVNWVNQKRAGELVTEQGWVEAVGVLPTYRGRGIATLLLCHSLNAFLAAGLLEVGLHVDANNPTGALRLYETLGFSAIKTTVRYIKQIP